MLKKLLLILGIILAFIIMALIGFRSYTKSFSPQETVVLNDGTLDIEIHYSRPYKKDRTIFGELVPYNEVWRTGANEATTFSTNIDLNIKGSTLPAGEYSLWTIPGKEDWQVIWNRQVGQWGLNPVDGKANRDPSQDQLIIEAPVIASTRMFNQFTIDIDKLTNEIHMVLMWENTMVLIPMTIAN